MLEISWFLKINPKYQNKNIKLNIYFTNPETLKKARTFFIVNVNNKTYVINRYSQIYNKSLNSL